MENNPAFGKWYSAFLGLFVLILVIAPKLAALLFVVFIPLAIIGFRKHYFQFKWNLVPFLFVVVYVIYAFYCIYTRNEPLASKYLEYKLSFILFPVLFSIVPKFKLNMELPVLGMLIGCLYLIGAGFIGSYFCDCGTPLGLSCYFSSRFSAIHHPSYASVYYTVGLFLVWYAYHMRFKWMPIWSALFLSFILVVALGMCLSLAGMLYFVLACAVTISVLIYYRWGKWTAWLYTIVSPLLLLAMIQFVPQLRSEWQGAKKYADEYVANPEAFIRTKKYPMSGSEVRLVMWSAAYAVFSDYPLGVGTGNVDEVLTNYLIKLDQRELAKQNYNPHNQYLQTGIEIGWFGLLVLCAPLLVSLFIARKTLNWLLLLLVSNLLFNMLFESMLQRQSGIMFYTFGICFLAVFSSNSLFRKKEQKAGIRQE